MNEKEQEIVHELSNELLCLEHRLRKSKKLLLKLREEMLNQRLIKDEELKELEELAA